MSDRMQKLFDMSVSEVYPLYVAKIERKGRTVAELDAVISWLTGFDSANLHERLRSAVTFREFFACATVPAEASRITGMICGVRVEQIEHPLARSIRQLDKLIDELAKGRPLEKVLRQS
ncbi:DUF2200 domain-containing protein [Pseudoclavibacter soli]|uniref:DUF2200 domain-containing protein n=1 Tax=Pseudoclavibacter soli TaxID=452623 RepID=UPI00041FB41E|nr:DUF2200 domain-containing protein [Pseudoclavibacter soli]